MILDDLIEEITPGLYQIGDFATPVFLIDAPSPVLVDAGYSFTSELYAGAVQRVLGKRKLCWCLITHTHFDHVGAVGYFKNLFPEMKIGASELACQIMSKQKSLDHISSLNLFAESIFFSDTHLSSVPFQPFQIDTILSEGDVLNIGNSLNISVLETPGHTRDSLCFYLNEQKTIFTGDCGGIVHDSGYIFYDFLSGCAAYIHSLSKICNSGAEILCPGHYNSFKGAKCEQYLVDLLPECMKFIDYVSGILSAHNNDINICMNIIKSFEYDLLPQPKQPEPAYLLNLEARLRSVLSFVSTDSRHLF